MVKLLIIMINLTIELLENSYIHNGKAKSSRDVMQELGNIFLLNLLYLAMLSWQPWASVRIGHRLQLCSENWYSPFPISRLQHRKPHATLFIIQPTSVCNSCPVLLLASHSEVTSLCTSTTALAFQHGSRTAAQQSSILLKSQRGPDQSRAGREPGSRIQALTAQAAGGSL